MNLPEFSVRHPIFVTMLVLIVLILGGISLWRIPIDLMPDISYPMLSISTEYENASPEEIEELITKPVERAVSSVPGVEEVSSTSIEGDSRVSVLFAHGTNLDEATNDIRDRLDRVISSLPEDAERPMIRKFDLSSFPVMILGAAAKLDPVQMRTMVDEQIRYRIERVPGVASVDVRGGLEREIHLDFDVHKLISSGIPLDSIIQKIKEENINLPAGLLEKGNLDVNVRTPGEYTSIEQIRNTVVANHERSQTTVGDLAEVRDSWLKVRRIFTVGGEEGLRLFVYKQSDKNTVAVAEGVTKELENIRRDFPQLKMFTIIDSSKYIERSINNLGFAAVAGGVLAILILLFFLRNIRSTAIISVTIPVSIVATFTLVYFNGLTLNIMTLGGLAMGVGMLVDNAIVVLDTGRRVSSAKRRRSTAREKFLPQSLRALLRPSLFLFQRSL